ncbi:MAG: tRNA 4-thiouridine(8) synthase ThiI [Candidatus Magasanikbacteria bacterium]|nr:tRNA 4-thiouridine(8) synthase ThiI [Candidatus Magasanikbacteria bacterium]
MKNVVLIHYDEIGLKGKNRSAFETKLMDNIRRKLKILNLNQCSLKKNYGCLVIEYDKNLTSHEKISEICKTSFGISNFSFSYECNSDYDEIEKSVMNIIQNKKYKTFRITARRSNKKFKLNSQEICIKIGDIVRTKFNKKVDLENFDLNIYIEIYDKKTYIYFEKIPSIGGLPTGVGGKIVTLLSGGIDSPLAAWYMQKRGLDTVLVHFHSFPFTNAASIDKVKELAEKLSRYSPELKLYLCPFGELQKKLLCEIPDEYRIIFYRRFMFRIANKIAKKEDCKAISTGESIGQVASQTIENISVIQEASDLPILRPLIGFDKKEIINKAKEVGTYETSILPHQDCCSLFLPKHPQTKSKPETVKMIEEKLDVDLMIQKIIENADKVTIIPH